MDLPSALRSICPKFWKPATFIKISKSERRLFMTWRTPWSPIIDRPQTQRRPTKTNLAPRASALKISEAPRTPESNIMYVLSPTAKLARQHPAMDRANGGVENMARTYPQQSVPTHPSSRRRRPLASPHDYLLQYHHNQSPRRASRRLRPECPSVQRASRPKSLSRRQ